MAPRARSTEKAVARSAPLADARAAVGAPPAPGRRRGGPGTNDPLLGDLRRNGLLTVLILHYVSGGPCYGHQLMDNISDLTGGLLAVNPNTMYPLLRSLEERHLIVGQWEHPERRSRRFYRITGAGVAERERLGAQVAPRLDRVAAAIDVIRRELLDR
jgi:DNA-binding PadR family transcriptional regulator